MIIWVHWNITGARWGYHGGSFYGHFGTWVNWSLILIRDKRKKLFKPTNVQRLALEFGLFWDLSMTCGDNKQCSKSRVQRKITKQEECEHGPLKKQR